METRDLEAQDDSHFPEIDRQFEIDSRCDSGNVYAKSCHELLNMVEHLIYFINADKKQFKDHHAEWFDYHRKRLRRILPLNYSSNFKEFNP